MNSCSRTAGIYLVGLLVVGLAVGCSTDPQPKLDAYLGAQPPRARPMISGSLASEGKSLKVGLAVLNDTTAKDSAPPLSHDAVSFLTGRVRAQVERSLPLQVAKVLPSAGVKPDRDPDQFVRLAAATEVDHVLLAVFSSAESEVPLFLPLTGAPEQGGGFPEVSGFEAINYALVELALLDGKTGAALAQANGRAWAKLNRLYVPVKSNAYPVIHHALQIAPIFPKEEEDAKDVLRIVAGDDALKQAVMYLQKAWPEREKVPEKVREKS